MRVLVLTIFLAFLGVGPARAADTVGVVDPDTGVWRLRTEEGHTATFYFGNPGDAPVMGDWDCDGIDTPGLYRRSDGYAYLRNTNTQGTANIRFFFGNPQDVPLAGDFDGDGCDTLSIYRPAEGRVYVINQLGEDDGGLGAADYAFYFGDPGDKPFVADFNGDGVDTVGLHRESTGFVYYRNANTQGMAENQFFYGDPEDRLFAGDWTGNESDTVGLFRPGDATAYLRYENSPGVADETIGFGRPTYLPVAGTFGELDAVVPTDCTILPADNIWNTSIDTLPVHLRSDQYVADVGAGATFHADFGSGVWPPNSASPIGIPFVEVPGDQPPVNVVWTAYGDESDPGPYPIPANAPIEGGPDATGDRHVLVLDTDHCMLYELFYAWPESDGSWRAANGAVYDLTSNSLRPDTWTSADAAGLPILPGLVRYDEVAAGRIEHAIRFTASRTQKAHVWPARHNASSITDPNVPPMGQRFRLKADFDMTGFSAETRVILEAMQTYGIILADNGAPWYISGAPDERWDNSVLHELHDLPGSAFEAVDVSSLMLHPDSGAVR
jgi:hypothetical protein